MTLSLNALTAPVSLTVLTAAKGNASKRLIAAWSDASPVVDPAHGLWISEGRIEHVQVPGLEGLRDLLGRITPKQALVHGVPKGSTPGAIFQLVVAEKYTGAPGTVARTLDCFSYPPDCCLLMFDYDPDPTAQVQVTSAEDLVEHMATLWPVFGDVGYLRTVSTRSAIRPKGQPDVWLTPPHGMHVYFLATGDVARFRELLKVKLWCVGLGFCKLATANTHTGVAALLERALVDLTVLSPERLDYVAGAQIPKGAPFYQDRPAPEIHAGIVLNLDELPDATDEERQEYARRLEAARETLRPGQREHVRRTVQVQAPDLQGAAQEQEVTRRLTHAERDELLPEHILYFPSREITAQDLTTKAGKALDGKRLKDPQEPDYGPSQAVFHWRGGDWRIVSWAHGVLKTYRFAPPPPPSPEEEEWAHTMAQADAEVLGAAPGVDDCPYENTPAGIVRHTRRDKEEITIRLTNFTAAILADVLEDDGVETRLFFELGTRLAGQAQIFKIPASQFAGMNWVTEHMGGSAIIMPGMGLKDHARAAIQMLSPEIASRHIYTHIGWRQLDTGWAYLHAGGAVGAEGLLADVTVEPGNALAPYVLRVPETPTDGQAALLASMQVLTVAPPPLVVPLYGALWRALLGTCDLSVHLTGDTGLGKSALAALVQQHWGAMMDAKSLPAAWTSTANALEGLAFQAKDAILVIDDFCPRGSPADVSRLHGTADRLFRAQGNRSARQRLDRTGRDRPAKPPRGLVISTGEDIPQGQSLRARICILEVTPETLKWAHVTPCQAAAAAGLYTQAMAAFVQWLAPHYGDVVATLPQDLITLRAAAVQTAHRRTPELIANLALGWRYFLACAHDLGVLSAAECAQFWAWAWRTLGEVGSAQQAYQADDNPVTRFLALLRGAITAGQAHVQDARQYGPPHEPREWGWTVRELTSMSPPAQEWTPHGACIGYLEDTRLYLEPEASYSVVQRMAEVQRAPLAITQRTLYKRMHEQGLIIKQPSQDQYAVSKRLGPGNTLHRVIDLTRSSLDPSYSKQTSNNGNTSNMIPQDKQNQDDALLLVPSWHTTEPVTSSTEPVTSSTPAPASVTGSVTGFTTYVTGSVNDLSPQLIEKKKLLLKLLVLLVHTQQQGVLEEESARAAAPFLPAVGDWITPLSLDGVIIPAPSAPPPYRIDAIEHDKHAVPYARLDVGTYWPLAQCEHAAPPAPALAGEVEKGVVL